MTSFVEAVLVDCEVVAKKPLINFQDWCSVALRKCRFKGRYLGNDFGFWPDGWGPSGAIEHGDFSEAILDQCRIMTCDPSSIRFPTWPCFTFVNPVELASLVEGRTWPGSGVSLSEELRDTPERTRSMTYYAPSMAKRFLTDEGELRRFLEGIEGGVL